MSKDKRLGRGLAALLGTPDDEGASDASHLRVHGASSDEAEIRRPDVVRADPPHGEPLPDTQFVLLDVNEVEPNPFQPRRDFGQAEIDSLAESLKAHEQLQPILVRQVDGRFQLISGERRWRAAKKAGLAHIKAQVRDADDRLVAELAIVENLQRKDLNAIEKALSFKRYLDEHHCTQEDLGKRLKIDRSTIANLLRLLELPGPVQDALRDGKISAGHARALLPLGDHRAQVEFSNRIQQEGVSVRATEQEVQELIVREDAEPLSVAKTRAARTQNQQIASLEQDLRRALGAKVDIRNGTGGRGRIVIHFKGHDDFERLHGYLMDGDYDDGIVGEAS